MPSITFQNTAIAFLAAGIFYLLIKAAIRLYFEEKRRHTHRLIKDITKGENET